MNILLSLFKNININNILIFINSINSLLIILFNIMSISCKCHVNANVIIQFSPSVSVVIEDPTT